MAEAPQLLLLLTVEAHAADGCIQIEASLHITWAFGHLAKVCVLNPGHRSSTAWVLQLLETSVHSMCWSYCTDGSLAHLQEIIVHIHIATSRGPAPDKASEQVSQGKLFTQAYQAY